MSDYEDTGTLDIDASAVSSSSLRKSQSRSPPQKSKTSASDQYQKLSQLEHILKRPDTYIGSVEKDEVEMWCFDAASESMVYKKVTIVPGLFKIFDEILVNAADNKIRDPNMRNLKVEIKAEENTILVFNDGKGIPVEVHDKEKMYIPEMIFGNLLTSSNYDDDEKKVTGGRNGYGAKLCNIFSDEFIVETSDQLTGLLYKQTWTANMLRVSPPIITKVKNKREYTKITFKPDLSKFGMTGLDEDILCVLRRRVYDLCGTVKDCNVYLNDQKLSIRNFKAYVEMYVKALRERSPEIGTSPIVHEVANPRWELAFALSDGNFKQVSFVNSIATTAGGTHVKYILDQIVDKLMVELNKGKDKKKQIKPMQIKNHMFLFVNCLIENPAFTSQTKEQLTSRPALFASKKDDRVQVSPGFIKRILNTGLRATINDIISANERKQLSKDDGSRKVRIKNQVKLVDANKAGTREGYKCTLILTEGLSALATAVDGLTVVGRDYYGCFPLRGKLLNVREASADAISKNQEITALKQIIGLQHRKHYTQENLKELRYGHVMIMTDQDHDGSHIKGLLINFFESSFPGLLNIPGFLLEFVTPIVKVTIKGRVGRKISFYSMPEFEKWRDTEGQTCLWTHKYYKGLGTSKTDENIEYFSNLSRHMKEFHALQDIDSPLIELAFSKKRADDRKDWLQGFQPGTHLDSNLTVIPISNFVNEELILFSMADNIRSIPSVLDGLKPSQRKVLFGCFKRKLYKEVQVATLSGYITEHTAYHHGEQSLIQTIIGLAQNFVGSNNLNLLLPNGNFGSRALGGKDSAAARYINTQLANITRQVFNPLDDPLYTYVQDDTRKVEPDWYLPILPMLLVNGSEGIGTGWSTSIPSFNPLDIVANIRKLMNGEELDELIPWYRGWDGIVEKVTDSKWRLIGHIEETSDTTVEISEIPVTVWINNYREFLLDALNNDKTSWIKDMEEQHTSNIRFIVTLTKEEMEKTRRIGLVERFRLSVPISLANMVAFDPSSRLKRYSSPNEMLTDFFYVRLEYYQRRKDYLTEELQNQLLMLTEQARFVKSIIEKRLSISNKKRAELVELLKEHKFAMFDKSGKYQKVTELFVSETDESIIEDEEGNVGDITELNKHGINEITNEEEGEHKVQTVYSYYDYLLGMSLWALTRERFERLMRQRDDKEEQLNILLGKSAKDLWNEDLDAFLVAYDEFLVNEEKRRLEITAASKKRKKTTKRKVKDEDEEYGAKRAPKRAPVKRAKKAVEPAQTATPSTAEPEKPVESVKAEAPAKPEESLQFFAADRPKRAARARKATPKSSAFADSSDDDLIEFANKTTSDD